MKQIKPKCAICRTRKLTNTNGMLIDYSTLLNSMGYVGHKLAHTKCMVKAQQMALNLKRVM